MDTCIRKRAPARGGRLCGVTTLALLLGLLPAQGRAGGPTVEASAACATGQPIVSVGAETTLTLRDAVASALIANPDLAVVACELRVAEARLIQPGLFANPQLRLEVENVGGSGTRQGDEQAETTVLISQLFELGGKRARRVRAAGLARDMVLWDYEARRLSVVSATVKAFLNTLAAQERVVVADKYLDLVGQTLSRVQAQVDAGAVPAADLARARVAVGRARIRQQRAARGLAAARGVLASLWGSQQARFARVTGSLRSVAGLVSTGDDTPSIAHNPDVARWGTEETRQAAALALADSQRIPNVTVGAGGRYFSNNGDGAVVVELSIPLPVFDRGQGAAEVARHGMVRVGAERQASARRVAVALADAQRRMEGARAEAILLRDHVLPEARRAVVAAQAALGRGLIHFTDLLAAEVAELELRQDEIGALEAAHVAAVDIARLTGTPVALLGEGGTE